MEKCRQVKLRRTNIYCGELGIGCEGFSKIDKYTAKEIINTSLDKGINFIDLYASNPVTRKNIGYAIRNRRSEIYTRASLYNME